MREPILFVVTGPSGSGKGTIMRAIIAAFKDIVKVATFTTRLPRPNEENGFDYNFVTAEEFRAKIERDEIAEYEQVYHDHYYGSPQFDPNVGPDRLMELDFNGMYKYKKTTKRLVSIFIAPPSLEVIAGRITRRSQEVNLERRMGNAYEQLQQAGSYDYIIINEDFEAARAEALAIVLAERLKRDRERRATLIKGMCENR
ncbi:MAG: Guanylate kinase [Firmicutes bacterium]|nr:Guanylate kinase [Bacillota bacterium]